MKRNKMMITEDLLKRNPKITKLFYFLFQLELRALVVLILFTA